MARRVGPVVEEISEPFVDVVERTIRGAGAVGTRKLCSATLSKRAESDLLDRLSRRGLERTGRFVRVPLAEQLSALLDREPVVGMSALKKKLAGAGPVSEIKHVTNELVARGRAHLVVRGGKEHLAAVSSAVISPDELRAVAAASTVLAKMVKSTRPRAGQPARTLLREDVASCLAPLVFGASDPPPRTRDLSSEIFEALSSLETHGMPLVFIPRLAEAVRGASSIEDFRQALVRAERKGRIELQPGSGVGLLGEEDAALCPRAPNGTVLSYVRRRAR